ncbi:MAG TPA: addiction module toxin RelE [Candidatus Hydrogenedentes bacterium]|nr:addiction module toxin RelE [Candidatus Hydrogenedentota bacterium]
MDDDLYRHLQNDLLHQPTKGEVMRGCGGIRKIRLASARRGKGKRGGVRV